ncbi:MAG: DUF2752 domain-containing protein [Deltaproteobacteria bacterium]|nr:MAG: DUF2752 domain-containing protein [Deltaproteobacteria bacterium]
MSASSATAKSKKPKSIFSSWWFGDSLLLALCASVVFAAIILTPTPEFVEFFGTRVPETCGYKRVLGMSCPGCGLTRSFTYMAHLDPLQAFRMNWMGPPFFLFVLIQVPYRVLRLARQWRDRL